MPIDYTKSKIYRIVCNETGETYYGSTTQTLAQRMTKHRQKENECKSKQIIERGNYHYVICEECPCENKEQLHAIERKWIEENECVNKVIPCRTKAEYYDANKEALQLQCKIYKDTHKEEIKEYREAHKQYHKDYYQKNKQRQKEQREARKNKTTKSI